MGILSDWQLEQIKPLTPFEEGKKRPGKISYGVSSYGYDCRVGYIFDVFSPVHCSVIDPKNFDKNALVRFDLSPVYHAWQDITQLSDGNMKSWICIDCKLNYLAKDGENPPDEKTCLGSKPDHILIPPNSFALAETIETFDIPRDCLAVVVGKSTYARCGIIANVTPLEPEWRGKVTIEISNTAPCPAKISAGEGICQVLFFRSDGLREKLSEALVKSMNQEQLTEFSHQLHELTTRGNNGTCRISYANKGGKYQNQTGLTNPKVD